LHSRFDLHGTEQMPNSTPTSVQTPARQFSGDAQRAPIMPGKQSFGPPGADTGSCRQVKFGGQRRLSSQLGTQTSSTGGPKDKNLPMQASPMGQLMLELLHPVWMQ
jgi:hypothetical protein